MPRQLAVAPDHAVRGDSDEEGDAHAAGMIPVILNVKVSNGELRNIAPRG